MAEKLKKEDFVTIFLVHLHLDVVPEVLLMVGTNFLAYISPVYCLTKKKKFDNDVLCQASPGCCSRGSPGDEEKSLFYKTCRYSRMGDAHQISR